MNEAIKTDTETEPKPINFIPLADQYDWIKKKQGDSRLPRSLSDIVREALYTAMDVERTEQENKPNLTRAS